MFARTILDTGTTEFFSLEIPSLFGRTHIDEWAFSSENFFSSRTHQTLLITGCQKRASDSYIKVSDRYRRTAASGERRRSSGKNIIVHGQRTVEYKWIVYRIIIIKSTFFSPVPRFTVYVYTLNACVSTWKLVGVVYGVEIKKKNPRLCNRHLIPSRVTDIYTSMYERGKRMGKNSHTYIFPMPIEKIRFLFRPPTNESCLRQFSLFPFHSVFLSSVCQDRVWSMAVELSPSTIAMAMDVYHYRKRKELITHTLSYIYIYVCIGRGAQ